MGVLFLIHIIALYQLLFNEGPNCEEREKPLDIADNTDITIKAPIVDLKITLAIFITMDFIF